MHNTGSDMLDKIMQHKAQEVAYAKSRLPLADMKARADDSEDCRGFVAALKTALDNGRSAVISEIKKASPSKGVIRADFHPAEIAEDYQRHGASCLSVLTDAEFFQGSALDFTAARRACTLPMLRKDFLLDQYQIFESRAMGADCILLIVAALQDTLLQDLSGQAFELGLDVLLEVHNAAELQRGLALKLPIIGINNRNLRSFDTSLSTTLDLLPLIPKNIIVVTESGIHDPADIALMRSHQVNSFLVGEAFMRAEQPGQRLAELFFN